MPPDTPENLIVFDGVCVLCNGFVRFVHRFDRAGLFRFATAQSPVGQGCLQALGLPMTDFETFVVIRSGQPLVKSTAVLAVLHSFGGFWRAMVVLGRVLPGVMRDWLYDRVARNRFRLFGRHAECPLPPPGLRERFVAGGF